MIKYYQVFISSPTKGFELIRNKIINEIIRQDRYFPIAMEFMTADPSTFDMLFSYMRSADVCVLLLSNKEGSKLGDAVRLIENPEILTAIKTYAEKTGLGSPEELSYTEYEYAVAQYLGVRVITFVQESVVTDCEEGKAPESLARFYEDVRKQGAFSVWKDEPAPHQITNALDRFIRNNPELPGWIREKDSNIFMSAAKAGIRNISLDGYLPREKLRDWIAEASLIKLCYTTGRSFIISNNELLAQFISRGGTLQFLCCKPESDALKDVQTVEEMIYGDRSEIHKEFFTVISELNNIMKLAEKYNKELGCPVGKIEIAFLSTLFRSSFSIFINEATGFRKGWFTVTLPPAKSKETVSFEIESREDTKTDNNLMERCITYFDCVCETAEKNDIVIRITADSPDDAPHTDSAKEKSDYWYEKEAEAKANIKRRKRNRHVLIEVAAQHPLVDGMYPNEEFKARLDRAIDLFRQKTSEGFIAEIYVPGSVHLDGDGVADYRSLSEAGCEYLKENGIPEEFLHGNEMNNRYDHVRAHKGVYNTADECYIAAQIFMREANPFRQLYSVCSPNQLMRKTLFYVEFGIFPAIITVPTDNMFHNFFNEMFRSIPYILDCDKTYQDESSAEAIRTRKERMPGYNS